MKFHFKAKIYKVGINPCVKVPLKITIGMKPARGYLRIKGKIQHHSFVQTLVPVKNEGYRLYVNGPMLKGAGVTVGQRVEFTIEQDFSKKHNEFAMPQSFKQKLTENDLILKFNGLSPSKKKEILRYLSFLKSKEALDRNIDKIVSVLKGEGSSPLFRL